MRYAESKYHQEEEEGRAALITTLPFNNIFCHLNQGCQFFFFLFLSFGFTPGGRALGLTDRAAEPLGIGSVRGASLALSEGTQPFIIKCRGCSIIDDRLGSFALDKARDARDVM